MIIFAHGMQWIIDDKKWSNIVSIDRGINQIMKVFRSFLFLKYFQDSERPLNLSVQSLVFFIHFVFFICAYGRQNLTKIFTNVIISVVYEL